MPQSARLTWQNITFGLRLYTSSVSSPGWRECSICLALCLPRGCRYGFDPVRNVQNYGTPIVAGNYEPIDDLHICVWWPDARNGGLCGLVDGLDLGQICDDCGHGDDPRVVSPLAARIRGRPQSAAAKFYRMWNEAPTVPLIVIVIMVVVRPF